MLVKIFDEEHEQDLEDSVNNFLRYVTELIDIKYSVAIMNDHKTNEQIYCYSAMIIYQE
jgi:hypothetical protein